MVACTDEGMLRPEDADWEPLAEPRQADRIVSGPGAGGPLDLHLIFPPQWSPFQPFLSTPSLVAYLGERGFRIAQSDWNVGFYNYFIGPARLPKARLRLLRYIDRLTDEHAGYRARAIHGLAILQDYRLLRARVEQLRDPDLGLDLPRFKDSVEAFQKLLEAFSVAEPVIELGTTSLGTGTVMSSLAALDAFVADEEENPFVAYFQERVADLEAPRYFGLSIIGIEQLVPGLTLCRLLKERFPEVPIVIGGSVFSRLVEKDAQVAHLFTHYFDYVCRYEGEQPMATFLASDDPRRERTPNMAFLEAGQVVLTPLCDPLGMDAIPTPDFSGIAFAEYLSPRIVLPLLTTRGCYWGKCAFCYHGMIYQDRYRMRDPALIAGDVYALHRRHGVTHFTFNDEALPPKMFRLFPAALEHGRFFFTGLYKFEKYFRPEDYQGMYEAGFRSVYIGLESASERVQAHMQKRNLQSTMLSNLQGAHDAGIWNHTFNFFGFPTETEAEAQATIDFLLDHADIIHSEGTGTFSFEHNAPIHHDPARFGVAEVTAKPDTVLELYYDYRPLKGIDADQAQAMLARFTDLKTQRGVYQTGRWIPREYLLILLSHHTRDALRAALAELEVVRLPRRIRDALAWISAGPDSTQRSRHFVVNKVARQVFETNEDAISLLSVLGEETSVEDLVQTYPSLGAIVQAAYA